MKSSSRGFTLLELMIVIIIMAMIAAIVIVYSNQSRNQVALSVETAKIGSLILQAKQLAVATYNSGSAPACGYGVYFNIPNNTYSLFIYSPQNLKNGQCPGLATLESPTSTTFSTNDIIKYSDSSWNVSVAQGVKLVQDNTTCLSAEVVLFYPPRPQTLMVQAVTGNSPLVFETTSTLYVDLQTVDGKSSENIAISPAGQVSY